jgi:hypothetical protein
VALPLVEPHEAVLHKPVRNDIIIKFNEDYRKQFKSSKSKLPGGGAYDGGRGA